MAHSNRRRWANRKAEPKKPPAVVVEIVALSPNARFALNPPKDVPAAVRSLDRFCVKYGGGLKTADGNWSFMVTFMDAIVTALRKQLADHGVKVHEAPKEIMRALTKACPAPADVTLRCPPTLRDALHPYQRKGVQFILEHNGRALLADDMGLGKTVQTLACCAHYYADWPMLIIVPSSVAGAWESEIAKWLPMVKEDDVYVAKSSSDALTKERVAAPPKTSVLIISYALCKNFAQRGDLRPGTFSIVVADESHSLKNPASKRAKWIAPLLKGATRAICCTGTPALSRPAELFVQINALYPKIFPTFKAFGERYCGAKLNPFSGGKEYKGATLQSELQLLLRKFVMIRRQKHETDVGANMVKKTRRVIMLEDTIETASARACSAPCDAAGLSALPLGVEARWMVAEVAPALARLRELRGQRAADASAKRRLDSEIQTAQTAAYVATGKAKVAAATLVLRRLVEVERKHVVVFAHHAFVIEALARALDSSAISYIEVHGRTPTAQRSEKIASFQAGNAQVALLGLTCAGVGITLTRASVAVFAELYWNPAQLLQAEDRIHRLGAAADVEIVYLVAPKVSS